MIQQQGFGRFGGQGFGVARSPAVASLQSALRALAVATRDGSLNLTADGAIGPRTVAAVNRAFTVHIGPGQAPATFRTGRLTAQAITNQAGALTTYVNQEAARRGAKPAAAPGSAAYMKEMEAQIRARVPSAQIGPVPTKPTVATPVTSATMRALIANLQRALAQLGTVVRDGVLIAVKPDGVAGPRTVVAVNRAFTTHIGPGQSPAQFRTGRLTTPEVQASAPALTILISKEAARRSAVSTPGAPAATVTPAYPPTASGLQNALGYLARSTGDRSLAVRPDGKIGPATAAAVNRALVSYVRSPQAAPYKTGRLTVAQVKAQVATLTPLISGEAAARHFGANPPATSTPPRGAPAPTPGSAPVAPTGTRPPRIKAGRSAPLAVLQTRLGQLGRLTGDTSLMVTVDGVTGPKTAAAVNKALTGYVANAPAALKTGRLTAAQVRAQAPQLAQVVADEVSRRGSTPAIAPPEGSPAIEPESTSDEGGGGGGQQPADEPVTYQPPAAPYTPSVGPAPGQPAYAPPEGGGGYAPPEGGGGGGGEMVPGGGGGEMAPPPEAAASSEFPWKYVGIGVGVLALTTVVIVLATKKSGGEKSSKSSRSSGEDGRSPAFFPEAQAA
jgi:lysozyme family protein